MSNWSWFPLPRSWVNAIALVLLMAGFQHLSSYLWWLISWIITFFPKFIYLVYLIITFSPILLIAIVHHWLHQLLDQFFPESRLSVPETNQSLFPGLLSWWEGLYGWLVNHLSTILSWAILGVFLPFSHNASVMQFSPWSLSNLMGQAQPLFSLSLLIQIIFAALFYQFEFKVQQRLQGRTD